MKSGSKCLYSIRTVLIGLCTATILLGLTTGSVLAVEVSDEDHKSLQAHKKKEADKQLQPSHRPAPVHPSVQPNKQPESSLAEAATNPIANLMQFQLQDTYNWKNYNSDGYANVTTLQAVIPVKLPWEGLPMLITRSTLPYVTTPDLGDPIGRKRGFGDAVLLLLATPKLKAKDVQVGLGINTAWPTAGDNDFTGSGKYEAGPAALYINMRTPSWQWGLFGYQMWDYASGSNGSDRPGVSKLSIQPVLTKHFKKGWYVASPDTPQTYDFKSKKWTLALGAQVGRVMNLGKHPVKLFGEVLYNPEDNNGATAEWTAKINITFLLPE
jgi:hypothetical protein